MAPRHLNRNVVSSFCSFLVSAIYALTLKNLTIFVASLLCLCTSVCHHSLKNTSKKIRIVDMVVVNSIGSIFLTDCYLTIPVCLETQMVYLCAMTAFMQYMYQLRTKNKNFGVKYHWLIHVVSNTGIGFYVFAKHQQMQPQ
jgi:hypothetical protein